MQDFCHLGMHSRFSFLRGTMEVETICRKAAFDGQRYAALADVNSLAGAVPFVEACRAHGLRPVVGVDVRAPGPAGTQRVLLFARTAEGYAELCELTSHLHLGAPPPRPPLGTDERGEPGPPFERVMPPYAREPFDLERRLRALSGHVLVLTADPALLGRLAPELGERLFALVSTLPTCPAPARRALEAAAAALRVPGVAVHDVYFLTPADHAVHRTLRAMDENRAAAFLSDEEAGHPAQHWVSRDWMIRALPSPAPVFAIRNLLARVELELELHTNKPARYFSFPGAPTPRPASSQRYLDGLVRAAFDARYGGRGADERITAGERMEKELRIIEQLAFADYFLIAHDVVGYARRRGFQYLGRGSGANSFVAFLLGITQVNPLVLDLYFERFLNPARSAPPDFDLDFSWRDRDAVLAYVFERFGPAHVAMLSTHVTLRGRGAIRQIGRTLGLTEQQLSAYTKRLPSHLFDDPDALAAAHPEALALDLEDPALVELLQAARLVYGTPTHYGVHAGGVLVSSRPITTYTALTLTPKGLPVTQLDMHGAEAWGLLKLDLLSTRGLGTFTDALRLVRAEHPEVDRMVADARTVLADAGVRRTIREARTLGVFYVESPGMRSLLQKLRIESFRGLTAASSIIRPGVSESGMMQQYVERHLHVRRTGRLPAPPLDPELYALLEESYGVMIYQEDVLKVAHLWAGVPLAEADLLRRAMSGKTRSAEEMRRLEERFFEACRAQERADRAAREVWRQIRSFAGYSFCKSHSASYAKLSMQQAYLKSRWPAEFMVSCLRNGGGYYHPQVYVYEARRLGVPVLGPCVFESEAEDALVRAGGRKAIRLGLGRVANLSARAVRRILEARRAGAFLSVEDFLKRTAVEPAEAEVLVDVGALDALEGPGAPAGSGRRRRMWELCLHAGRAPDRTGSLFPLPAADAVLADLPPPPPYTPREILHAEISYLDLPLSFHPMDFVHAEEERPGVRGAALPRLVGRRVRMTAWLMALKRITTRGHGRPMAFLTLYDGGEELFEAVLFPAAYARLARAVGGCGPYELEGRVEREHGVPYLNVFDLRPFARHLFDFESSTPWVREEGASGGAEEWRSG